jgi:hypothetical protein
MIEPGKDPEIRQLENGMLRVAKFLPNLGLAALRLVGRILKGVYNGLLGRTAVKPESKEAADQKNKKEHLLVRGVVGLTKVIGAVVKGLSYVGRGSYNTVQRLRGKELEKITNEPSLSRESSFKKESSLSREGSFKKESSLSREGSFKKENSLSRESSFKKENSLSREGSFKKENSVKKENPVGVKDKNQVKNSKSTNQKKRVISSKVTKQKNLAKDALKKSVSFTEKQRKFIDIQTYGRKKSARINMMKKKQEALTSQRTQPVRSAGM